jgi:RNA polymerase sigma factor (TIGR02999 family)
VADVTRISDRLAQGETKAGEELLPLLYDQLRRLAASKMARQTPGQTLQPTALVHEAYLRLIGTNCLSWSGPGHFFAAAAEAMRRILIERARHKASQKAGGRVCLLDLASVEVASETGSDVLLALDEVLGRYAERDPTGAELIKLRFFVGLTNPQAAAVLNIAERTAERTWAFARAWLLKELQKSSAE